MSGWGTKDSKTATGTVDIDAAGAVTGTSTLFTSEARVGDFLKEAGGQELIITAIASDTAATVASPESATISAVTGATYALSEKPKSLAFGDATNVASTDVYGVDRVEMTVTNGPQHAGWVRRTALSGSHNGRVQYETLVALSSGAAQASMGDADDDTQFADA